MASPLTHAGIGIVPSVRLKHANVGSPPGQRELLATNYFHVAQGPSEAHSKQTDDGKPVQSFQTLMDDLGTITKNTVVMNNNTMQILTTPTALQQRAFDLLEISVR